MKDEETLNCLTGRKCYLNIEKECLPWVCQTYCWVNRHLQKICKSLNQQAENQSILSFLCSQFECKTAPGWQPAVPSWPLQTLLEGHLALLAHRTSPRGERVRFLAQISSFCLQGHSCLIGGSYCLVWHRSRARTPLASWRRRKRLLVMAVSDNMLAHVIHTVIPRGWGATLCQWGGGGDYMQEVKIWVNVQHEDVSYTSARRVTLMIWLFSCRFWDIEDTEGNC